MLPPLPAQSSAMGCIVCGQDVNPRASAFLIECHYCSHWLHGACVQVSEQDALLIAKFACFKCQQHGHEVVRYRTHLKLFCLFRITNNYCLPLEPLDSSSFEVTPLPVHFSDYASSPPAQFRHVKSSLIFRRLLNTAIYARSGVHMVSGQDFRPDFLHRNALDELVLITGNNHQAAGLDKPFPVLNSAIVADLLTQNREMRTIDVATQSSNQLTATMWHTTVTKSNQQDEHDAFVANAEFQVQHLPMQCQVAPPVAVAQVDWHNYVLSRIDDNNSRENAGINVFGAFLERNAYLDFTIVPGGQCTWLSVSSGELWVFLISPTSAHFDAYRNWKKDPDFATIFLPEHVDKCTKCVVRTNDSLLVPAGWMFARYAGGVQSCSLFFGYFACTTAMEAQLGVVLLEMQHDAVAHDWKDTTSDWLVVNANVQLWTAVCYYIRQLATNNNALVNDLERRALQRALPRLIEWSARPASLKSKDGIVEIPSSQREAQTIISRLEQALDVTCLSTHSLDDLELTYGVENHNIPLFSPNDIYSDASIPNAMSGPCWESNNSNYSSSSTTLNSSSPMESVWPSYQPTQQDLKQYQGEIVVTLTQNLPFSTTPNTHTFGNPDYKFDPTGVSSHNVGFEGLSSLNNVASNAVDTASVEYQPPLLETTRNYVDLVLRHRASCHRCGNLRKTNVPCPVCPHIFCAKCAEKMIEEHGNQIFETGCPVCKEVCCCGKNRSTCCTRKFHCYKKCPSTKRPASG